MNPKLLKFSAQVVTLFVITQSTTYADNTRRAAPNTTTVTPAIVDSSSLGTGSISFDICCPPWNKEQLFKLFQPVHPLSSIDPYNYIFNKDLDPQFLQRMQSYINHIHDRDNSVTKITISLRAFNKGTGNLPTPHWPNSEALGQHPMWLTWTANSPDSPNPQPNPIPQFFKSTSYGGDIGINNQPQFEANRWYAIGTGIYLEGGKRLFPKKCDENAIYYRWSTMGFRTDGATAVGVMEISDGKRIIKTIPIQ